jgi:steroid delta-isomerase-like uncharacterized protein
MRRNALILTALLMVLTGCASSTREAAAPVNTVALGQLLDEWSAAWSSNDVPRLLRLFTEDVYYEDVPLGAVSKGRPALRDFASSVFNGFTDLKFERKTRFVSADGRVGAIEWVFRGRQVRDFPGMPATNQPFEVRGSSVVEFRDGKISRNSDYWDLATYMRQVGLTR